MKQVAKSLKIELASYREMQSFAQFGSDLDSSTKKILAHGAALMEVLKQKQYNPYPLWKQVCELFVAKNGYLDALPAEQIAPFLLGLDDFIASRKAPLVNEIDQQKKLSPETEENLKKTIEEYISLRK